MMPQRQENDPSVSLNVANKMRKLVSRGYITEVFILALKSFFSLPKGTYYISMVFDTTVSGLNYYLWSPKFMLPSMGSLLMIVGLETQMFNINVGEVFYNF